MAEQYAQTSTNRSNRAKPRDNSNSKVVYKPTVDNPFKVDWPAVPDNVQNSILARVVTILEGVEEHYLKRASTNRGKKRARTAERDSSRPSKKKRITEEPTTIEPDQIEADAQQDEAIASGSAIVETPEQPIAIDDAEPPAILQHITFGINQVTKLLEQTSQAFRKKVGKGATTDTELPYPSQYPRVVLVCRADMNPPKLIAHLPYLVSACNSARRAEGLPGHIRDDIHLVPLGKGAELALASAMGLRRVSILAIHSSAPELAQFLDLLQKVPILRSAWLVPPLSGASVAPVSRDIIPTHIKMLKTTAPKDMKASKEERLKRRAKAKESNREKKARDPKVPKRTVLKAG